jgi:hypothetical protein
MRDSLPLVLIASFSLLTGGCSKDITRTTALTIFSVDGTVTVGTADRKYFQQVSIKSRIHEGDIVRSSDRASIDFALFPSALVTLFGDSEMKIEQLAMTKDGNETADGMRDRVARIRLSRGKIAVLFIPSDRSATALAIATQNIIISPNSDCLFSVQTDGAMTRVTCAEGEVQTSAGQPSLAIRAGYFHQWPGSATTILPAADHAAAQMDITESVQAGERLIHHASARQNRRPL